MILNNPPQPLLGRPFFPIVATIAILLGTVASRTAFAGLYSEGFSGTAGLSDRGFSGVQYWVHDTSGYMRNDGPGGWGALSQAYTPEIPMDRTQGPIEIEWKLELPTNNTGESWREQNKVWVGLSEAGSIKYQLLWKPNREEDRYTSPDLILYKEVAGSLSEVHSASSHLLTPTHTHLRFKLVVSPPSPQGDASIKALLDNGTGSYVEYLSFFDDGFQTFDALHFENKTGSDAQFYELRVHFISVEQEGTAPTDTIPPVVRFEPEGPLFTSDSNVTFEWFCDSISQGSETLSLPEGADQPIERQCTDAAGNVGRDTLYVTVDFDAASSPPQWPFATRLQLDEASHSTISFHWDHEPFSESPIIGFRIKRNGIGRDSLGSGSFEYTATGLLMDAQYDFRVEACNNYGCSSDGPYRQFQTTNVLPPDPAQVVPPLVQSQAMTMDRIAAFLHSGSDKVQEGLQPGALIARKTVIVRGRVLDASGEALVGVTVSILGKGELGSTVSGSNGQWSLAANGDSRLTVDFRKAGFLHAQRSLETVPQAFAVVSTVRLIPRDTESTMINFTETSNYQTVVASQVSDNDGTRQAKLTLAPGTKADLVYPDGTRETRNFLTLRATEYTVGDAGPQQMPADLPPTSFYTYAVEIQADEAEEQEASTVEFDRPAYFYVENFRSLPVGIQVPAAYYDRNQGIWVPIPDGRILEILGESGGFAEIDISGNGNPATQAELSALGIESGELSNLASQYSSGDKIFRIPITHMTPYDFNYGISPEPGSEDPPKGQPRNGNEERKSNPNEVCGSIIECQNQTLREHIELTGIPFELVYNSDRVPGRNNNSLKIPIMDTIPTILPDSITLDIGIAGNLIHERLSVSPNQIYEFEWDGKDAFGRKLLGPQIGNFDLRYWYRGFYNRPPNERETFGLNGPPTLVEAPFPAARTVSYVENFGFHDDRALGLGGWSIDALHRYDPISRKLYLGDGGSYGYSDVEASKTVTFLRKIEGYNWGAIGVSDFGDVYFKDNFRIYKMTEDGVVTHWAGNGTTEFEGSGVHALQTGFGPHAFGGARYLPDRLGGVYVLEQNRIHYIKPNQTVHTVIGTESAGFNGEGNPASQTLLNNVVGATLDDFGNLYIADKNHRIIMINSPILNLELRDPLVQRVAGNGSPSFNGENVQALEAGIDPLDIAWSPDGSIYFLSNNRLRRITSWGTTETLAGNGQTPTDAAADHNLPALEQSLCLLGNLEVLNAREILFQDKSDCYVYDQRIRRFTHGRGLDVFVGDGNREIIVEGQSRSANHFYSIQMGGFSTARDGSIYLQTSNGLHVVHPTLPEFRGDEILIPSRSGSEIFVFDPYGRHTETRHSLTGEIIILFEYDTNGYLVRIRDGDGNTTVFHRHNSGTLSAIESPYGHVHTISLDANGYLNEITNPNSETFAFSYTESGLLVTMTEPMGQVHVFGWDSEGRLQSDQDPAGATQTLTYRELGGLDWEAELLSAEGMSTVYRTQRLPDGGTRETITESDGLSIIKSIASNGQRSISDPTGQNLQTYVDSDPRLGVFVPFETFQRISSPSGLAKMTFAGRGVEQTVQSDPFSLVRQIDTLSVSGRNWIREFNAYSKRFTSISPENRKSFSTIDGQGRITSEQVDGLLGVNYEYDENGRLSRVIQGSGPGERAMEFLYDQYGFLEVMLDPLGRTISYEYDLAGRAIKKTLPDGSQVLYDYDANGNLIALQPPGRPNHDFLYNQLNLELAYQPPPMGSGSWVTETDYNLDRQLLQVRRPDGKTLDWAYDAAGRPSGLQTASGAYGYTYNMQTGQLSSMISPSGVNLAFSFDGVLPISETWSGPVSGAVSLSYDNSFRTVSQSINGADSVSFSYDDDDKLVQAGAMTLGYDAITGLLTSTTLGPVEESISYSSFGEPSSQSVSLSGSAVFNASFTRDKLGRITEKVETVQGAATTYHYTYDAAGRLETVTENGTLVSQYSYDANGNRLTHTTQSGSVTGTYDDQDRMLSYGSATYSYNAYGDLESRTEGSGTTNYLYDENSNLRKVTLAAGQTIEYLIDGKNRRVGKVVNGALEQQFLYQDKLNPVAELDGSGSIVARFVYASKINVPDYMERSGAVYRIVSDYLGSVRLVIEEATGQVVQRMDYDEFGNVLFDSNPGLQPFGYAGGLYDRDIGLIRFGARDYDPETGRWTEKDPVRFDGGVNFYVYVKNDPVNFLDLNGEHPVLVIIGWGVIVYGTYQVYKQLTKTIDQVEDFKETGNKLLNDPDLENFEKNYEETRKEARRLLEEASELTQEAIKQSTKKVPGKACPR